MRIREIAQSRVRTQRPGITPNGGQSAPYALRASILCLATKLVISRVARYPPAIQRIGLSSALQRSLSGLAICHSLSWSA
jgi:hypothetical protein